MSICPSSELPPTAPAPLASASVGWGNLDLRRISGATWHNLPMEATEVDALECLPDVDGRYPQHRSALCSGNRYSGFGTRDREEDAIRSAEQTSPCNGSFNGAAVHELVGYDKSGMLVTLQ